MPDGWMLANLMKVPSGRAASGIQGGSQIAKGVLASPVGSE
jgi:hypothetical protein